MSGSHVLTRIMGVWKSRMMGVWKSTQSCDTFAGLDFSRPGLTGYLTWRSHKAKRQKQSRTLVQPRIVAPRFPPPFVIGCVGRVNESRIQ